MAAAAKMDTAEIGRAKLRHIKQKVFKKTADPIEPANMTLLFDSRNVESSGESSPVLHHESKPSKSFVVMKSMRRESVFLPEAQPQQPEQTVKEAPANDRPLCSQPQGKRKKIKKYKKRDRIEASPPSASLENSFSMGNGSFIETPTSRSPQLQSIQSNMFHVYEKRKANLMAFITLLYYYLVNRSPEDCSAADILHLIENDMDTDIRIGRHVLRAPCLKNNWTQVLFKEPPHVDNEEGCIEKETDANVSSTWVYISKASHKRCGDPCACKTSQGHLRISKSLSGKQLEFFTLDWKGRGSIRVFSPIT